MNKQKGSVTIVELILFLVLIVGCTGWVKNLLSLADCDFESPYKAEVVHTVGLIPIVGAFTGYMDFGK